MVPNRLALGAMAMACISAAGIGGYVASRQNAVPTPAAAASPASVDGNAAVPDTVQETEAVVTETPQSPSTPSRRPPAREVPPTAPNRAEAVRAPSPQPAAPLPSAPRQTAPIDHTEPAGPRPAPRASGSPAPAVESTVENGPVATLPVEERQPLDVPPVIEPPRKLVEEVVVASNAVIGLQTENRISSETARVEDRVEARVTRDVKVGDVVAIPAGSKAIGSVIEVERGGKFKEGARLGIRFTTLLLADGTQIPIGTDTIFRQGEGPGNSSAAKIGGGAVGGAILGAILGGAKGAAIGATAGAGGGAAIVQAGERSEVTLPAGSPLTVRLVSPLTVTVEK